MIDLPQVTIVGTGLLGGSLGLGLRAAGYRGAIVGVGRRRQTLDLAQRLGCIDRGTTDLAAGARDAGLIVLATPLGAFQGILEALAACQPAQAVVTDVGSTKDWVCQAARRTLPHPRRFVGSHPMAGSERQGPEAARPDLFQGKPCILTPDADSDPQALQAVGRLWTGLGMRLLEMSPLAHDQAVATVSHLPHVAAALLVRLAARTGRLPTASTGFRDTTRVAGGDPDLWTDILATNRAQVLEAIDGFIGELATLRRMVDQAQADQLREVLAQAAQARAQWLKTLDPNAEDHES